MLPSLVIGVGRGKKQMESDFVRRSSRRQKVRGEREFIVNSDMMLRDFKVKVKEVFFLMIFSQFKKISS